MARAIGSQLVLAHPLEAEELAVEGLVVRVTEDGTDSSA